MTKLSIKILVKSDSAIESAFPLLYLLYLLSGRKGIKKRSRSEEQPPFILY